MSAELNDAVNGAASDEDISPEDARLIELVGHLVQGIVAHPDEVEVEEYLDDLGSVYGVRVHPDDVGRVIGKEGRVANALRHMVKAAATKTGERVTVEIITDDAPIPLVESDFEPSGVEETGVEPTMHTGQMPAGGDEPGEGGGGEASGDV
jgi:predicted RNA-binding protein YlqC (UPF0109 family)